MKRILKALILGIWLMAIPSQVFGLDIGIAVSVNTAPPLLPVYVQPPCPQPGYIWTPGYWAYGPMGYYWVPGVWVAPPRVGLLWTPGYWAFVDGFYRWHPGFWGRHVGFYGGVDYGYGYTGVGFVGGYWRGPVFLYNTAVVHVDTTVIHNTYVNRTVIRTTVVNRYSFNGAGGVMARPTRMEMRADREPHFEQTSMQVEHQEHAGTDRNQFYSANGGHPETTAMNRINGRRYTQQGRIAQGMRSGQLTAGETRNLEQRQANLHQTVHNDRLANGGSLTGQEKQNIRARQNNISRSIYNDKHNAAVAHYGNNEVGQRRYNQQQRMANGISSGQMGANRAARLEGGQQNLNRRIRADRQANGGRLTNQQRRNINRRQNRMSRRIYRSRHHGRPRG